MTEQERERWELIFARRWIENQIGYWARGVHLPGNSELAVDQARRFLKDYWADHDRLVEMLKYREPE